MLLALSSDQELFLETTAKLLDELVPVGELRRLRDDPVGFDREYWRRGAELGWTSLLIGEERGGGSIGEFGLVDLALVAYQFGRHAAPGPLAVTNVVAATLGETGQVDEEIAGLVSGASRATWCLAEPPPNDRLGSIALEVRVDGDDVVLNGVKRPVESAAGADFLL
ncbi:MAG TPA: acyl-CoA dehydrogenase family protein, partial [Acidimicrobiales bacterium]